MLTISISNGRTRGTNPAWSAFSQCFKRLQPGFTKCDVRSDRCDDPIEALLWDCWLAALADRSNPEAGRTNPWWSCFVEWYTELSTAESLTAVNSQGHSIERVRMMLWEFWQAAKDTKPTSPGYVLAAAA